MPIIIICMIVLLSASSSVFSAIYGKQSKANPFLFGTFSAFVACLFFLCYNKFQFVFDPYTLLLSCLFAFAYLACTIANIYAMMRGSVALTSLFSSFSLLLPTLFGILYWHEEAKPTFYIGLLLFCVAIVLSNNTKKEETAPGDAKSGGIDLLWLLLATVVFFSNGSCSIIQTFHQKTGGIPFKAEFMIMALIIVFITNLILSLLMLRKEIGSYVKPSALWGGLYGVCNAGINLGVMLLASGGEINQSVFFPVISIGTIALVLVTSIVFFKEKLRPIQYIGVGIGIISIVLLQL